MATPPLGTDPVQRGPSPAALTSSAKLGGRVVQITAPSNQGDEDRVTGKMWASFQAVCGQEAALSARLCSAVADSSKFASQGLARLHSSLFTGAAAVFGSIRGGARSSTCTQTQREQALTATIGCGTKAREMEANGSNGTPAHS